MSGTSSDMPYLRTSPCFSHMCLHLANPLGVADDACRPTVAFLEKTRSHACQRGIEIEVWILVEVVSWVELSFEE